VKKKRMKTTTRLIGLVVAIAMVLSIAFSGAGKPATKISLTIHHLVFQQVCQTVNEK
jgi:hypothetical protein